jgi:hypothetical protein
VVTCKAMSVAAGLDWPAASVFQMLVLQISRTALACTEPQLSEVRVRLGSGTESTQPREYI